MAKLKKVVDLSPKWSYTSAKIIKDNVKQRNNQKQESIKNMQFYDPNFVGALGKCVDEQYNLLRAVNTSLSRYSADESLKPVREAISRILRATDEFRTSSVGKVFIEVDTNSPTEVTHTVPPLTVQAKQVLETAFEMAREADSYASPDVSKVELRADDPFPIMKAPEPVIEKVVTTVTEVTKSPAAVKHSPAVKHQPNRNAKA